MFNGEIHCPGTATSPSPLNVYDEIDSSLDTDSVQSSESWTSDAESEGDTVVV